SLAYAASGRGSKVADPQGYLLRWRDRAPLTPAVESLRLALGGALAEATPAVRPKLAASLEPAQLRQGLERAVDRSIAGLDRLEAPASRWWSLIGLLQTVTTVAIALAAAWVVVWILARPAVDAVEIPLIGIVPAPFVALVVTVLIGYGLARALGLHAGWIGRRWARRVRDQVTRSVRGEITERGFGPLDELEAGRRRLWLAVSTLIRDCSRS
ncbi:MAG: hypothetical protein M3P84_07785, partial [Chloroflexota bacterium]|nr:hypothetical protein [Chloroflexota bacterium]